MIARVCVALVLLTPVGCGGSTPEADTAGQSTLEAPVISGEPAGFNADDVAFATNMVVHHKQAIEMAELVSERSTNPQVQALAEQIAAVQQPEINVLNVLLVQWNENPEAGDADGHGAHASMPGMVDDATMERLASLSGAEFDRLWLGSMIDHHRGAVEVAKAQIANGDNVDAIAMARRMVAAQEAEIEQMSQLQKELG